MSLPDDAGYAVRVARGRLGPFTVVASDDGVRTVWLPGSRRAPPPRDGGTEATRHAERAVGQLEAYLAGEPVAFDVPLDWSVAAGWRRTVLQTLREHAPYGRLLTYGELSRAAGRPGEARAVGGIMGSNPLPVVVPCHRVVAHDGLGGYGGGLALKRGLLELEGVLSPPLPLPLDDAAQHRLER